MTDEQIKSIENGIWLCRNCHKMIDRDKDKYKPEVLKLWKKRAEDAATAELGKVLPSKEDAIDTLTMASRGQPIRFLPDAISNVHSAIEEELEKLDPRFEVSSLYNNGKVTYELKPKEDVNLPFQIKDDKIKDNFNDLIKHGNGFTLTADMVNIEGSILLQRLLESGHSMLVNSPIELDGVVKISLTNPSDDSSASFNDVVGLVSVGTASHTFKGSNCEGLFGLSLRRYHDTQKAQVKIDLSFHLWDGESISELPYFRKLLDFFAKISKGWLLNLGLEIKGEIDAKVENVDLRKIAKINDAFLRLNYIYFSQEILRRLNTDVLYDSSFGISSAEYRKIESIVVLMTNPTVYNSNDISGPIYHEIVLNKEGVEYLHRNSFGNRSFLRITNERTTIKLFGTEVIIPQKITEINLVKPIFQNDISKLKAGDKLKIQLIPLEGFELKEYYEGI